MYYNDNKLYSLKILIVDDDELSYLYLSLIIKKICREILHAKNGLEAIECCKRYRDIDVVIMNYKMPIMNGYEATREIRKFNIHVCIIADSICGMESDIKAAFDAGCNDFLEVPIRKDLLLNKLRQVSLR